MNKDYQRSYTKKALNKFIEEVFEIAYGDDAINREFYMKNVVETLKEYAEKSWQYEELDK